MSEAIMQTDTVVLACGAGVVRLPPADLVLVDRLDGGNLIVDPPRPVWERSLLLKDELCAWTCLVAATGAAMLAVLPQLAGGCVNYWEAGNWALNEAAEPRGHKSAAGHRRVHLHLLGRSPNAASVSWRWGEAPAFPRYLDRHVWASGNKQLLPDECSAIAARTCQILRDVYGQD